MIDIMGKASPVDNFKHERKNGMDVNMVILLVRRVLQKVKFLGQSQTLSKKLDL